MDRSVVFMLQKLLLLVKAMANLIIAAVMLYTLLVVVLLGLLFAGSTFWVVSMSSAFALLMFVPLVVLVPLAFFWRSWQLRGATLLLFALFLLMFGGHLLPTQSAVASVDQPTIRVATMNHWLGNTDYDGLVAQIRALDADVITIQEVTPITATVFDGRLYKEYPYRSFIPIDASRVFTQLVLSKYPLSNVEQVGDIPVQQMVVDLGDRQFVFMSVHLRAPRVDGSCRREAMICIPWYNSTWRDREYPTLLAAIDAIDAPLVVAGDFNTSETESWYQDLELRLLDVYDQTNWGFGFTFPNAHPLNDWSFMPARLVRIDYVWTKLGVEPVRSWIDCSVPVSDHCAVVADLVIPESSTVSVKD